MRLTSGQLAMIACLWEVTARKPGNVHRTANLPRLDFADFLLSAAAIGPVLDRAADQPLGQTILQSIQATRAVVQTNTNLGTILLLVPLAAASPASSVAEGVDHVLRQLTVADAEMTYEAIRLAEPGGLGEAPDQDLSKPPTLPLNEVMALAADRDLVARQYVNDFGDVLQGVEFLKLGLAWDGLEEAIVFTHLQLMAFFPDSLIARKLGREKAEEAAKKAKEVLDAGWPETDRSQLLFGALDVWLRADGNRRNPGTSADMVAATLYVALREGLIPMPSPYPWSAGFIS